MSQYYNLDTYLQAILRKDYSPEALQTQEQKDTCAKLLVQKAIDHDINENERRSIDEYNNAAYSAIEKFIDHWQDKQHGDDPRGKTSLGHLANAVMDWL